MQTQAVNTTENSIDLVAILERDVYPRLQPQQIYNWSGHDFKESGNRLRGKPPWGESKSGSSFAVFNNLRFLDSHNGNEAGDPVKYLYSLKQGHYSYPKGKDWINTVRELFEMAGIDFPEREWSPAQLKQAQRRELRQRVLQLVQDYCQTILWSDRGETERLHLILDRGFTDEGLKEFGIGLYPSVKEVHQHLLEHGIDLDFAKEVGILTKTWEGYMVFPWANPYGQPLTLYGHQTKEWVDQTGKPKKYALFNPKQNKADWLHTKESPYLLDHAIRERHNELILVEGIVDAAIAHQYGDSRVIACVAAMLSKDQAATLARHRIERVIICLDPDKAGEAGIESCVKSLTNAGISAYVAPKLVEGLDPDEFILTYGIDAWKSHVDSASHALRWKAQKLVAEADLTTDIGKEIATKEALGYANNYPDQIAVRQYFLPELEALQITPENTKMADPATRMEETLSAFEQVVAKMNEISAERSSAKRLYDFTLFRKELGITDRELKQIWQLSKIEQKPFAPVCIHDFITQNLESREWLISKFIPLGSVIIWYAESGRGKTLAAYDAIRSIATGENWLGSRVHKARKCLIIQTEESKPDTRDRLIIQGYLETVPSDYVYIENEYTFSQIDEMAEFITKNDISLVMIDSLTTVNQDSGASENDVVYANTLIELRKKIVNPLGCTVLIIHHENKKFNSQGNSSMRGSSAIKANTDFVVRIHTNVGAGNNIDDKNKLMPTERIFELEKARGGVMGHYLINLNTFNYRWTLVGEIDEYGNKKPVDDKVAAAIYIHLELNPTKEFSVKEIFKDLKEIFEMDAIRTEIEILRRIGEIGGRYQQSVLDDGTKYGYWKYYAVNKSGIETAQTTVTVVEDVPPTTQIQQVVVPPTDDDDFDEEF